ncbi:hypothetical protein AB4Z46_35020 [Variovorax sp. M-6]
MASYFHLHKGLEPRKWKLLACLATAAMAGASAALAVVSIA